MLRSSVAKNFSKGFKFYQGATSSIFYHICTSHKRKINLETMRGGVKIEKKCIWMIEQSSIRRKKGRSRYIIIRNYRHFDSK